MKPRNRYDFFRVKDEGTFSERLYCLTVAVQEVASGLKHSINCNNKLAVKHKTRSQPLYIY